MKELETLKAENKLLTSELTKLKEFDPETLRKMGELIRLLMAGSICHVYQGCRYENFSILSKIYLEVHLFIVGLHMLGILKNSCI